MNKSGDKSIEYEEDFYADSEFFLSFKYVVFSILIYVVGVLFVYVMYKDTIDGLINNFIAYDRGASEKEVIKFTGENALLLRNRVTELETLDGQIVDEKSIPTTSRILYCIGDIIETDFAKFQITDVEYVDLDDYFNRVKVTFLIENKNLYSGIKLTENTSTLASNSPKIIANTTNKVGGQGLQISRDYTDTIINRGTTLSVVGTLKLRKGEKLETLLICFDKNIDKYNQIDCTLMVKNYEEKGLLKEKFNPYVETGVIRASKDDVVYLENGVTLQVLGKYHRTEGSKFSQKPYKDKLDIGIQVKITNISENSISIAGRYTFVLIDSKGNMYDEIVYTGVTNIINSTYDRPILKKGESTVGFINFEAYEDENQTLLIGEKRPIVSSTSLNVYKGSLERDDSFYMVAIKLPSYGWTTKDVPELEKVVTSKKRKRY